MQRHDPPVPTPSEAPHTVAPMYTLDPVHLVTRCTYGRRPEDHRKGETRALAGGHGAGHSDADPGQANPQRLGRPGIWASPKVTLTQPKFQTCIESFAQAGQVVACPQVG